MIDPVLAALVQVEIDLQPLAEPRPTLPRVPIPQPGDLEYAAWETESNILLYRNTAGEEGPDMAGVKLLLAALYQIEFIEEVGSGTIKPFILEVANILTDIADKLGTLGNVAAGVEGLRTFLNAIQRLPGSPAALATASEILMQITALLEDIPSARNELYMISQQLKVFSDVFADPEP
jgi:hypothetical protein